jgi:ParB-like chromosome segregation protein Spo0J
MTRPGHDEDELRAFRAEIERLSLELQAGCGLSYELYARRLDDAVRSRIGGLPAEFREAAEEMAIELGHDRQEAERDFAPDSCSLTGVDIHCCPCGRHP